MRSPTALLTLFLIVVPPLVAQKVAPPPTRPRIQELADTNDARAYYRYGMAMLSDKPEESVRGFYWALQIDPSSAETMYALRTSSLLAMGPVICTTISTGTGRIGNPRISRSIPCSTVRTR